MGKARRSLDPAWWGIMVLAAALGAASCGRGEPPGARPAKAAPAATARTRPAVNSLGMKFVRIPAGNFVMGSDSAKAKPEERPAHLVNITDPFEMQTTEVTVGQFRRFVAETGYRTEAETAAEPAKPERARTSAAGGAQIAVGANWQNPGFVQAEDHPVTCVSWNDAAAFCAWLAKKEGLPYRLPTEAEWEFACRAGVPGDFCAGLETLAWSRQNSGGGTRPGGRKKPNAWGLYDMLGNVEEWCADWAGRYPRVSVNDPVGSAAEPLRAVRGGGWDRKAGEIHFPSRGCLRRDSCANTLGFRLARDGER